MRTVTKLPGVLLLLQILLLSGCTPFEATHQRETCHFCGMYIDKYQKTAAELVLNNGSIEHTCGVSCMFREIHHAGGPSMFKSLKVRDWISGGLVDARLASYVLGSKVIPDMLPNLIAFSQRAEAEAFATKEGGEVIDFQIAMNMFQP